MLDGAWTLRFAEQVNFFREFGAIKNSRELVKNTGLIHLFLGTGSDRRWWSGLCEVLSTGVPSGF